MESIVEAQKLHYAPLKKRGPPLLPHGDDPLKVRPPLKRRKIPKQLNTIPSRPLASAEGVNPLPASDLPHGFPPELSFRALAAYSLIRTLSKELRLSPFTPNVFLRALYLPYPNRLLGKIHVILLRTLLTSLQMGYHWSEKNPPLDVQKKRKIDGIKWPLRAGDNLKFLDSYTWPVFYDDYCHLTADLLYASLEDDTDFVELRNLDIARLESDSENVRRQQMQAQYGYYNYYSVPAKQNKKKLDTIYLNPSDNEDDSDVEDEDEFKFEEKDDDDEDFVVEKRSSQNSSSKKKPRGRPRKHPPSIGKPAGSQGKQSSMITPVTNKGRPHPQMQFPNMPFQYGMNMPPHQMYGNPMYMNPGNQGYPNPAMIQYQQYQQIQHAQRLQQLNAQMDEINRRNAAMGAHNAMLQAQQAQMQMGSFNPKMVPVSNPIVHVPISPVSVKITPAKLTKHGQTQSFINKVLGHPDTEEQDFVSGGSLLPLKREKLIGIIPGSIDNFGKRKKQSQVQKVGKDIPAAKSLENSNRVKSFSHSMSSKTSVLGNSSAEKVSLKHSIETSTIETSRLAPEKSNLTSGNTEPISIDPNDSYSLINAYIRGDKVTCSAVPKEEAEKDDEQCDIGTSEDECFEDKNSKDFLDTLDDWPQFAPLVKMRAGIPYHRLAVEHKLNILEFLLDELLTMEVFADIFTKRDQATGFYPYPYGKLPRKEEYEKLENEDECGVCREEGDLLCCDGCTASYHRRCLDLPSGDLPDGRWLCAECTLKDPCDFGSLKTGRKSSVDWFTVDDIERAHLPPQTLVGNEIIDTSNVADKALQIEAPPDKNFDSKNTQLLVVHGFLFKRHNVHTKATNALLPLDSKCLREFLKVVGPKNSSRWPLAQIPFESSLFPNQESTSLNRLYYRRDSGRYDPSNYDNKYRSAPLPLWVRKSEEASFCEYEIRCGAATTNILSTVLTSNMSNDKAIATSLRSSTILFDAFKMVNVFLLKLESDFLRASLLDEFWRTREIAGESRVWATDVRKCLSVRRLTKLLLELVDATHPRAFLESWFHVPVLKGKEPDFIDTAEPQFPLPKNFRAKDESMRRHWERCPQSAISQLVGKEQKNLEQWIYEIRPDLGSLVVRSNKRKQMHGKSTKVTGARAVSHSSAVASPVKQSPDSEPKKDSDAETNAEEMDIAVTKIKTEASKEDKKENKTEALKEEKKESELPNSAERTKGSERSPPKKKRKTRHSDRFHTAMGNGNGAFTQFNGKRLSESKMDLKDLLQDQKKAKLSELEKELTSSSSYETHWMFAGRKLFEPSGYLPRTATRHLGKTGGSLAAPFVAYLPLHEVGQASYHHIWRKRVSQCISFEELLLCLRMLEAFLDTSVIRKCTSLTHRFRGSKPMNIPEILWTQRDLKTGLQYHLLGKNGQNVARWVSCMNIDLPPLILDRYKRRKARVKSMLEQLRRKEEKKRQEEEKRRQEETRKKEELRRKEYMRLKEEMRRQAEAEAQARKIRLAKKAEEEAKAKKRAEEEAKARRERAAQQAAEEARAKQEKLAQKAAEAQAKKEKRAAEIKERKEKRLAEAQARKEKRAAEAQARKEKKAAEAQAKRAKKEAAERERQRVAVASKSYVNQPQTTNQKDAPIRDQAVPYHEPNAIETEEIQQISNEECIAQCNQAIAHHISRSQELIKKRGPWGVPPEDLQNLRKKSETMLSTALQKGGKKFSPEQLVPVLVQAEADAFRLHAGGPNAENGIFHSIEALNSIIRVMPSQSMAAQPSQTMASQPSQTMAAQPPQTNASQPSQAMASQPSQAMASQNTASKDAAPKSKPKRRRNPKKTKPAPPKAATSAKKPVAAQGKTDTSEEMNAGEVIAQHKADVAKLLQKHGAWVPAPELEMARKANEVKLQAAMQNQGVQCSREHIATVLMEVESQLFTNKAAAKPPETNMKSTESTDEASETDLPPKVSKTPKYAEYSANDTMYSNDSAGSNNQAGVNQATGLSSEPLSQTGETAPSSLELSGGFCSQTLELHKADVRNLMQQYGAYFRPEDLQQIRKTNEEKMRVALQLDGIQCSSEQLTSMLMKCESEAVKEVTEMDASQNTGGMDVSTSSRYSSSNLAAGAPGGAPTATANQYDQQGSPPSLSQRHYQQQQQTGYYQSASADSYRQQGNQAGFSDTSNSDRHQSSNTALQSNRQNFQDLPQEYDAIHQYPQSLQTGHFNTGNQSTTSDRQDNFFESDWQSKLQQSQASLFPSSFNNQQTTVRNLDAQSLFSTSNRMSGTLQSVLPSGVLFDQTAAMGAAQTHNFLSSAHTGDLTGNSDFNNLVQQPVLNNFSALFEQNFDPNASLASQNASNIFHQNDNFQSPTDYFNNFNSGGQSQDGNYRYG